MKTEVGIYRIALGYRSAIVLLKNRDHMHSPPNFLAPFVGATMSRANLREINPHESSKPLDLKPRLASAALAFLRNNMETLIEQPYGRLPRIGTGREKET
jgi:hypothetical protein